MEDKTTYYLRHPHHALSAIRHIQAIQPSQDAPMVVEIKPMTRNLEQNALLHALLTDISRQCEFAWRRWNVESWKTIMVSGHAKATGKPVEIIAGIEGELINIRESTAKMSTRRIASLIEYIQAWAADQGVRFSAK